MGSDSPIPFLALAGELPQIEKLDVGQWTCVVEKCCTATGEENKSSIQMHLVLHTSPALSEYSSTCFLWAFWPGDFYLGMLFLQMHNPYV